MLLAVFHLLSACRTIRSCRIGNLCTLFLTGISHAFSANILSFAWLVSALSFRHARSGYILCVLLSVYTLLFAIQITCFQDVLFTAYTCLLIYSRTYIYYRLWISICPDFLASVHAEYCAYLALRQYTQSDKIVRYPCTQFRQGYVYIPLGFTKHTG